MKTLNAISGVTASRRRRKRRKQLINSLIVRKVPGSLQSRALTIENKEDLEKVKCLYDNAKKDAEFYGVSADTMLSLADIKSVKSNKKGKAIFLDTIVYVRYSEILDWDYSKSRYPKVITYDRKITFTKKGFTKTIDLKNFAGDFILKSYLKVFKIKPYKQKGFARKIQLNDYLRAKKLRTLGTVEIWERTLNKVHYDFVAVQNKTTFHASNIKEAVAGLKAKINAKLEEENENITKKTGFKLGFCETGMKSFCEDNNLNFEGSYTRQELRNIILEKRSLNCSKYSDELKKIRIVVNCR